MGLMNLKTTAETGDEPAEDENLSRWIASRWSAVMEWKEFKRTQMCSVVCVCVCVCKCVCVCVCVCACMCVCVCEQRREKEDSGQIHVVFVLV